MLTLFYSCERSALHHYARPPTACGAASPGPATSWQNVLAPQRLPPTLPPSAPRRYCCYLLFQLRTHASYFSAEEEGEDEPVLSLSGALGLLAAITVVVAICSE